MVRRVRLSLFLLCTIVAACTSFSAAPDPTVDGGGTDAGGSDAAPDVIDKPPGAVCAGAFAPPTLIMSSDFDNVVSARRGAGNVVYVSWDKSPDTTVATGTIVGNTLSKSTPNLAGALDGPSPIDDQFLAVSENELGAVWASNRIPEDGGTLPLRLFSATRASTASAFDNGGIATVPGIDRNAQLDQPWIVSNNVYFTLSEAGQTKIVYGKVDLDISGLMEPEDAHLPLDAQHPVISANQLEAYYSVPLSGKLQVHRATRPNVGETFAPEGRLPMLNEIASNDYPTWISKDACEIWIVSDRAGTREVYRAERAAR